MCDLVIRGGLVAAAGGAAIADLGVRGERIAQLGGEMTGAREIDAHGLLVVPGGIDVHVHLTNPGRRTAGPAWVDDFASGSAAAFAGGITTLGNMSFLAPGELPLAGMEREGALASDLAMADFILHPVLREPGAEALAQIPQLMAEGHNTIKFFTAMPDFDAYAGGFLEATARAGAAGMLTMIHCEDHAIMARAAAALLAAGMTGMQHYPESRPAISEVVATQRAVAFAAATGAPVYIVHLSSAAALDVCRDARASGLPVYVETRPLYLHLTRERFEEPEGAKYVGQPPLRDAADVAALWAGLRDGTIDTVCSDHAPWSLAAKLDPSLTVANVRPGVADLETEYPMLYSEGVRKGRLSVERFVALTATHAAKLFGLYPQKGCIAVGSDADLAIYDPKLRRRVGAPVHSRADYSPYDGWEVTGWPVLTVRCGQVVYDHGTVTADPGSGRLLRRGPVQPL